MTAGARGVGRRRVFYIPGYDPFPPRRYRELYRSEAAAQAAVSGHRIAVSASPLARGGWRAEAEIGGKACVTEFEVLLWSDIVRASMGHGLLATYAQMLRTLWMMLATGTLWRLLSLRKGPTIAALYPVLVLSAALGLAVLAGWGAGLLVRGALAPLDRGLALAAGVAAGAGLAWACLALLRRLDGRIFAFYLMHDYAHAASCRGAWPADLEARLGQFRAAVAQALKGPWDEVLVVGHSSGAHLAVSVLAGLLRETGEDAGRQGPALSLLTLGHVVPMMSFLPEARGLRTDLRELARSDRLTWVDVTAPGDGCAYALCDPVAVSGVAPPDKRWPLVISAAFTRTLRPETWARLKRRFFRLHFQYLCAFDALTGAPGEYDYFAITAGPLTLAERFAGRAPSPARIERAVSGYRTLLPEAAE